MQNRCFVERKDTTETAGLGAGYRSVLLAIAMAAVMLASASVMVFADESYANEPDDSGDDDKVHYFAIGIILIIVLIIAALIVMKRRQNSQ